MTRRAVLVAVLSLSAFFLLSNAWAEAPAPYPSRQLTYLITFDPGGQSDREARRQQPYLSKILGQQVVVDYKVGGGGALGWKELVRSKPDGYLFAGFNIPHTILQPLQQNVGYKTEQLVPVALFQRTPLSLAVPESSPYKTLKDFIDDAKKEQGKVSIGGSSLFSGAHFTTMRFEKLAGIKLSYVPFTGSAPQITALLGGHTDGGMCFSDDVTRFRDKVRILAMATENRMEGFQDVPTFKELGFDLVESVDRGIAVPPNTPKEVVAKLEAAFLEIAKNPDIQSAMKAEGFVPLALGAAESKAYLDNQTELYKKLFQEMKK